MAQLRHDDPKFKALSTEILVIVPNGPKMIEKYVRQNNIPYSILSDRGAKVAAQYAIETKRFIVTAFTPSVFLVDHMGRIRYTHYLPSYIQEPDNGEPLAVLTQLMNQEPIREI